MSEVDFDFEDDGPLPPATPAESAKLIVPTPRGSTLGRTLPHSLEAEEYLLSCILLDGSTTLEDCIEFKLPPQAFYSYANQAIYRQMVAIFNHRKTVDIAILAEELKSANLLDGVGGYPYLIQISGRVPTTAQSSYFLSKVHELYQLRELIKISTSAVERAFNQDGDTAALVESTAASIEHISSGNSALSLLEGRSYDPNNQAPKPTPVLTAKGTTICTPGNLTTFYAQSKVGKTATVGAAIASSMVTPEQEIDCLGFHSSNYEGYAVIHIDTEQSRYDYEQMVRNICIRAKRKEPPPWLMTYHLTGLEATQCRTIIKTLLRLAVRRFKKVHSLFIDGIGDLVTDPNDAKESFGLITELHGLAIEFDCPVISILHMNAGSENEKGRGHLGSQLERKSESNIMLEKNGNEVTTYWGTKQRGKTIPKKDGVTFRWSDEHQMHMSCSADAAPAKAASQKWDLNDFLAFFPFKAEEPRPVAQIYKMVSTASGISKNDFRDLCDRERNGGLIERVIVDKLGVCYRKTV